ncbi:MAG TPA: VWA domain-containing protein [Bdellovibrionota bacterium]|jgi:Ca-activated chloride channel family protein|nr:VWA domain-containing protein [Bdellovibrionota bacterium]
MTSRRIQSVLAAAALLAAACLGACSSAPSETDPVPAARGALDFDRRLSVDEYIQAFPQGDLPGPGPGEDLRASVGFLQNKPEPDTEGEAAVSVAQVALRTRDATLDEARRPMGIVVVVDVSGSMLLEGKWTETRRALRDTLVGIPDGWFVSLITFNETARVAFAARKVDPEARDRLLQVVEDIKPDGGTDIQAGLKLGFAQMQRFGSDALARLVLITDGRSNVGSTDPKVIAQATGTQYLKGARLSTIGLGGDVDEDFLKNLAEKGGGRFHLATRPKMLADLLQTEVRTLVVPAARDTRVELRAQQGFRIRGIYGHEDEVASDGLTASLSLGDLPVMDARILMVELQGATWAPGATPLVVTVTHLPVGAEKPVSESVSPPLQAKDLDQGGGSGFNRNVARNAVVLSGALALQQASRLARDGDREGAAGVIRAQLADLRVARTWDQEPLLAEEERRMLQVLSQLGDTAGRNEVSQDGRSKADPQVMRRRILTSAVDGAKTAAPGPWSYLIGVFQGAFLPLSERTGLDGGQGSEP